MSTSKSVRSPATWVPSLYFAMGMPYALGLFAAGTMLKNLGHSDTQVALLTGSLSLAWSLKPFWASFLDMFRTKRFFVLTMEGLVAAALVAIALALELPGYLRIVVALLWVMAFASATQDICANGIYMTVLEEKKQDTWMGLQSASWNAGRIFAASAIVMLAGLLRDRGYGGHTAWTYAIGACGVSMGALAVYHYFALPTGAIAVRPQGAGEVVTTFTDTVVAFFQKKSIWGMLIFVFLYRAGEGLLLVEAPLFMQSPLKDGGLGLTLGQKGMVDGTVGTLLTIAGGFVGAEIVARYGGLKKTLMFLALSMNVPHLCYIFLSHAVSPDHPLSLWTIYLLVGIEKFGYGVGQIATMLYIMQQIAPGKYKMAHFAFADSLMNLVFTPTQSASGYLADTLGYKHYFIFVLIASVPSVIASWKAPFTDPPDSGEADAAVGDGEVVVAAAGGAPA
jgi:PAT family beta-lactamase induction signal transducer AmpG